MSNNGQMLSRMQRIEELVQQFETGSDPHVHAAAAELVQLLLDLHGGAVGRMLEIISKSGAAGGEIVNRFSQDPLIGQLLMLYDLHPVSLETRVQQTLDKVAPQLKSHGGSVELVSLDNGVVRLRLHSSGHGCKSSVQTLRRALEETLYEAAPDIAELEIASDIEAPPLVFVPLETIRLNLAAERTACHG